MAVRRKTGNGLPLFQGPPLTKSHPWLPFPGPPRGAGGQLVVFPRPVQRRRQKFGGGAAGGCAAAELPADLGLLLHGPPEHERGRPVPADVHRRLLADPADHGEGHRVFSQGTRGGGKRVDGSHLGVHVNLLGENTVQLSLWIADVAASDILSSLRQP